MRRNASRHRLDGFIAHLAFLSRLPVPAASAPDFLQAWWGFPAAGAVLGVLAALPAVLLAALGTDPLLAAAFGVLALVALSGGLHEDGLADCCDALGGRTREKRLEILRDSRIGTFGALALVFSVLLRSAALSVILSAGPWLGLAALAGTVAVSRAAGLAPLALLPPARSDGLGATAGAMKPHPGRAAVVAAVFTLPTATLMTPSGIAIALLCVVVATLGVVRVARRSLGGQTGDVAGATIQVAEIVFLSGLATFVAT